MTDDLFGGPSKPAADAPRPKKPPTLYVINANARKATCTGPNCSEVMYWVPGRAFPLSANCAHGLAPNAAPGIAAAWRAENPGYVKLLEPGDGLGISHYENCPDAALFSGRRRKGGL